MVEISLRFIERTLFNFHVPFGLMKSRRSRIEILLGRIFLGEKFLRSRGIYSCELKCGLGGGEIAFGLRDRVPVAVTACVIGPRVTVAI